MRRLLFGAVLCLLAVPLAILATLALLPLWSWIEARFGIEAVGHSGPGEWCYVAVYAALALGATCIAWRRGRRPA